MCTKSRDRTGGNDGLISGSAEGPAGGRGIHPGGAPGSRQEAAAALWSLGTTSRQQGRKSPFSWSRKIHSTVFTIPY